MLTIYNCIKPNGTNEIVYNIYSYFMYKSKLYNDNITKQILADIEHGSYYDESHYIDRFGNKLLSSEMSTGSQALILATHLDGIICFDECGDNVLGMAIKLSARVDMSIYLSYPIDDHCLVINGNEEVSIKYNNRYIDDIDDVLYGGLRYDSVYNNSNNRDKSSLSWSI